MYDLPCFEMVWHILNFLYMLCPCEERIQQMWVRSSTDVHYVIFLISIGGNHTNKTSVRKRTEWNECYWSLMRGGGRVVVEGNRPEFHGQDGDLARWVT